MTEDVKQNPSATPYQDICNSTVAQLFHKQEVVGLNLLIGTCHLHVLLPFLSLFSRFLSYTHRQTYKKHPSKHACIHTSATTIFHMWYTCAHMNHIIVQLVYAKYDHTHATQRRICTLITSTTTTTTIQCKLQCTPVSVSALR